MVVGARFKKSQSWFVGALVLVGGCAYQPGSFDHTPRPFDGVYVTVACLDVAMEHKPYPDEMSNVVAYWFGNRCDDPVVVDLAAARVFGMTASGAEVDLRAFDPYHELRQLRLDARAVAHEAIDYQSSEAIDHVCIDAASIAHVYPTRWVCVDNR